MCTRAIFYTCNFCQGINNHEWWIFLIQFFFKSLLSFEHEPDRIERWTQDPCNDLPKICHPRSFEVKFSGGFEILIAHHPISPFSLFSFFFFSPSLHFFHSWKACIDHKRARTYTWRNLDGTQHVYKIMRSTVYPGYLRNRHKFIAIALLVEFPGNRIGKHRFPFLIVEGNARSRIKLMAVSHDENSWFFTMKNKFKSAGNCVEFVRAQSSESSFKFFLYLFVYLFIYIYFDPIHTVWWIQFLIFQRRNGHFVLVKRRLTIGQAGSWIPPVSINFRSH